MSNVSPRPNPARVLGVLGGMGPLATVDFLRKLLEATPATIDQEHLPVVVSAIPQVPDRTAAFFGRGESPLPALRASAQRLVNAGASGIVMPCNTAHLWFDELQASLPLPVLHLVDAALDAAMEAAAAASLGGSRPPQAPCTAPAQPVGLLATEATVRSGLYTRRRPGAVNWVLPDPDEQAKWITPGIAAIKAGQRDRGRVLLQRALQALQQRGAGVVLLGCTEIPLVIAESRPMDATTGPVVMDATPSPAVVDATAALARRAVAWARQAA
jgi:aspartate racemase